MDIGTVQGKIGKVQDQMRSNIELTMQRQEDVEGLADKSLNLQTSANQFSLVASRIREDQQIQQYKFYAMVAVGIVSLVIIVFCWGSPWKLFIGFLAIIATTAVGVWLINIRKQSAIRITDEYMQDIEGGAVE